MSIRTGLTAILLCGTLDIAYAIMSTSLRGGDVPAMLRGIAAGPFGDGANGWGMAGAAAGLFVQFALMAIMVVLFIAARRFAPIAKANPILIGALYGLGLYLVMYGLVMPLRFGTHFPPPNLARLANGLIPHILLVGIPMALLLRWGQRGPSSPR